MTPHSGLPTWQAAKEQPASLIELSTANLATLQDSFNKANCASSSCRPPDLPFCGSSAVETILGKYPNKQVTGFARWEPILEEDSEKPGAAVLSCIKDRRAQRLWDQDRLIAKAIKTAESNGKLHPRCCESEDTLRDLVAAYPLGSTWNGNLPEPVFFNDTIVSIANDPDQVIAKLPSVSR